MNKTDFKFYAYELEAVVDENLQYVDDHGSSQLDPVIEVTEDIAIDPSHVGCWMIQGVSVAPEWGWEWDFVSNPFRVTAVPVMRTEWKALNS